MTSPVTLAPQQWEHKIITRRSDAALLDELNASGQEGWELVSVLFYKDMKGVMAWTAFVKRPGAGEAPKPSARQTAAAATATAQEAADFDASKWPGLDDEGGPALVRPD